MAISPFTDYQAKTALYERTSKAFGDIAKQEVSDDRKYAMAIIAVSLLFAMFKKDITVIAIFPVMAIACYGISRSILVIDPDNRTTKAIQVKANQRNEKLETLILAFFHPKSELVKFNLPIEIRRVIVKYTLELDKGNYERNHQL